MAITTKKPIHRAAHAKSVKPVTHHEKKDRYIEAIGRRKTAIARVRLVPLVSRAKQASFSVNGRSLETHFVIPKYRRLVNAPFEALSQAVQGFDVSVLVKGGGTNAQAEAIRLGISRILVGLDASGRSRLKQLGYLKRDPRMVERKKFGSRKARRPQQWRKR